MSTWHRVRITRTVGKKVRPELQSGPATLRVQASRPVFRGLRQVSSEVTRDVQVRLDPPRLADRVMRKLRDAGRQP